MTLKNNKMIAIYKKKEIEKLRERVSKLERLLTVPNYFADCPCCSPDSFIPKSEAVAFEKYEFGWVPMVHTYYTTKQSYGIHKNVIDKWAKHAKKKS